MAAKQTSKKSTTRRKSSSSKSSRQQERVYTEQETELFHEISLILFFAVAVVLFLCNFGILGPVGKGISSILFGLFGLPAYAFSILLFFPFFDGAKISKTANIYLRCIVCFPRKKEQPGQADCLINDFLYKQSSYCSITRSGWHLPLFRGVAVAS